MKSNAHIIIGHEAIAQLIDYCTAQPAGRYTLISDTNTYAALGQRVEEAFRAAGFDVTNIVLRGDEVIADEKYLMQAMVQSPPGDQMYVAVGSGTLTDITRYVSYRTRNPFISIPTAPSVDGFMSTGAPLVVGGIKETFRAQAPVAVFADLQTSIDAPQDLKAAGFGDIVGKFTSLADWKLGHLVWDEPYDPAIDERVRDALENCIDLTDEIVNNSEHGVTRLMDALIESGICIFEFGDSRPASGSEHHCSHFWELQLLKRNRPAILHGAKVGYATTLVARLYEKVRQLSRDDVAALLAKSNYVAGQAAQIEGIKRVYGPVADDIMRPQKPFLEMTAPEFEQLKQRILDHWDDIQAIARTVPPSAEIAAILERAGAPTDWRSLRGLEASDVAQAVLFGHYIRNRFTVIKLLLVCGIDIAALVSA
jgi:glycerol-1-phosphate dehydrogenase [NAD(P)+]